VTRFLVRRSLRGLLVIWLITLGSISTNAGNWWDPPGVDAGGHWDPLG